MAHNVLVKVYFENVLMALMPLWDNGIDSADGWSPQSSDSLILQAKGHLCDCTRFTDVQINTCRFVVQRI